MNAKPNDNEIVRALYLCAAGGQTTIQTAEWCSKAAVLVEAQAAEIERVTACKEKLAAQNRRLIRRNSDLADELTASRRRERAAVEDLVECMTEYAYTCKFCLKWNGEDVCKSCKPDWRGPREISHE